MRIRGSEGRDWQWRCFSFKTRPKIYSFGKQEIYCTELMSFKVDSYRDQKTNDGSVQCRSQRPEDACQAAGVTFRMEEKRAALHLKLRFNHGITYRLQKAFNYCNRKPTTTTVQTITCWLFPSKLRHPSVLGGFDVKFWGRREVGGGEEVWVVLLRGILSGTCGRSFS